ncbi:MAG: type I-U CRISPR-associated helicase/endonuclease Cas3 [Isosphaeraceae bacterium]
MNETNFPAAFEALTGNAPFPWQEALYARFAAGDPPPACNLPTGLGKTSVIPIWLIALAANPANVPRRLVYVVNRRTVVDQATDEAVKIRQRLADEPVLRDRLQTLCADPDGVPLAISTLRGQFADNREWSADPSRPAVILGTVDMIGSRLLFSGYGLGFKTKPLHAGFLGQDALLVHDEAQLEPAFQELVVAIKQEQDRCKEFRRFRVMELSATSRGSDVFGLSEQDRAVPEVQKRIHATKILHLHVNDDEKKLADRLAELALQHKDANRAVLVFARTVEAVEKIAEKLRKGTREGKVDTLTGTLRGKERDELVKKTVFRRFLPGAEAGGETVYLVCTSAGEVGVNISADDLVCDLSTFESMAQRFGRVNRFGTRDDTRVDVVHPKEFDENDEYQSRLKRTLVLLRELNGDGNPDALANLDQTERLAAFSPPPTILPSSDILFDAWALTTIRDTLPGRPPVEPYLHGLSEQDPPQTQVAWREEVGLITGALRKQYKPEDLLEDYPLKPHEILRDRSDRVFKHLVSLAAEYPGEPVWLLQQDGTVKPPLTLGELASKEKKDQINSQTVLLPPRVNGLKAGLMTGDPKDVADDVADEWLDEKGRQRRARLWDQDEVPDGMRLIRTIDTRPDAEEEEEKDSDESGGRKRFWYWYVRPGSADDEGSRTSRKAVTWEVHTVDVERNAESIVDKLPLPTGEREAIVVAAGHHDQGKKRVVWQRGIGNPNPRKWLAKSGVGMKPIELTEYRHEFGSLLDAMDQPDFQELDEHERDLVLHLIAVHHGFGRPHFPSALAFDPEPKGKDVEAIAAEMPQRFARLQRKYGRWGLAYLESLLRAADYAASANPSATVEDAR